MNIGVTVIKGRRSVRDYKDESVPDVVIEQAIDCARNAPTARNRQPWLIGIIKDKATLAKIADATTHGSFIKGAPLCFAVFGEEDHEYWLEDCCAATTQLMLGLWASGVGSCWVAGAKKEYAKEVQEFLGVPKTHTLVSLVPAGYPATMTLPSKKKVGEIVFEEKWAPE